MPYGHIFTIFPNVFLLSCGIHLGIQLCIKKTHFSFCFKKLNTELSIGVSHQVSVHLAKQFQRRFVEIDQPETRIAYGSHVHSTDRDEISNLYRGPPIDASYQVSAHLAKRFQRRRFFRNRPIRNKNCLWWPSLLTDRDEMCTLYRGPSIDPSYQVSAHLAKRFQRRRFYFKSTPQKQELPVVATFVNGSG